MTQKKHAKKPSSPAPGNVVRRWDASGHMDPDHAQRLLDKAHETTDDQRDNAFVKATTTRDSLAEELGEEAVVSMTSGEDQLADDLQAEVEEERGGPFVQTTAGEEFAEGTDESNIAEATREPFPTT